MFRIFGLALLLAPCWLQATEYTFQTIDVPGSLTTAVSGLNDLGQIVGTYTDAAGSHAFFYSAGSYQTLTGQGAALTPIALNNSGSILFSNNVLYANGQYTAITQIPVGNLLPGGTTTSFTAAGLNNNGDLLFNIGLVPICCYQLGSVIVGPDLSTVIATSYGVRTSAVAFNDLDQIAAEVNTGVSRSAYFGGAQILPPNIPYSNYVQDLTASGVNNSGEVVGTFLDPFKLGALGFLYQNGTTTAFSYPDGGIDTALSGVNNVGQLIGSTEAGSFLATPEVSAAPEPWLGVPVGFSCAGMFFVARFSSWRRRRTVRC